MDEVNKILVEYLGTHFIKDLPKKRALVLSLVKNIADNDKGRRPQPKSKKGILKEGKVKQVKEGEVEDVDKALMQLDADVLGPLCGPGSSSQQASSLQGASGGKRAGASVQGTSDDDEKPPTKRPRTDKEL